MPAATVVAASVVCLVNGGAYGQAKSFHWSSSTPHREVHGIDDLVAVDLIPQAVSVTGTVGMYRLHGDAGIQGIGAGGAFPNIARLKFFVLQLRDITTGALLFEARNCVVTAESWGAEAKGIVEGSMSFKGLSWRNESTGSTSGE